MTLIIKNKVLNLFLNDIFIFKISIISLFFSKQNKNNYLSIRKYLNSLKKNLLQVSDTNYQVKKLELKN